MGRPKKDAQAITVKMDQATYDRLDEFHKRSGQPKTVTIERAVNMYIDQYDDMVRAYQEKAGEQG